MRKHLQYLSYVLRHKWYVFQAACKLGIPWLGVIHDLSKFRPDEWFPYAESFYGGPHHSWTTVSAYAKTYHWERAWRESKEGIREAFDLAWLLHQKRNKHHWQWWLLVNDTKPPKVLAMPDCYRREMLADWIGAGRAIHGKDDTRAWYEANRQKMQLHSETRAWIEQQLGLRQEP